jgi:hypothetical protein
MEPWNLASRKLANSISVPRIDPRNQIRVLRLTSDSQSDSINCDFEIVDLDDPSDYTAISYTWGDPRPVCSICVGGQILDVHQNCYDALQHIQQCYPPALGLPRIWIDAVCIDQVNLAEKSVQVQAMHRIFGNAKVVAISLGPSPKATQLLYRELRNLQSHAKDLRADQSPSVRHRHVEAKMTDFGTGNDDAYWIDCALREWKEHRVTLLKQAYQQFGGQAYWSRLWIVQELHAARSIEILHGGLRLPWDWLQNFALGRQFGRTPMQDAIPFVVNPSTVSDAGTTPLVSLAGTLEAYRRWKCSDPRDRIFGLLSIIKFPERNKPLQVDYRMSALELAMAALSTFASDRVKLNSLRSVIGATEAIFEALEIHIDCTGVREFFLKGIAQRQDRRLQLDHYDQISSDKHDSDTGTGKVAAEVGGRAIECWRLRSTIQPTPGLTMLNACIDDDTEDSESNIWKWNIPAIVNETPHVEIRLNDTLVSVACQATRDGDLLVYLAYDENFKTGYGLVLREQDDGRYDTLGQAWIHPYVISCTPHGKKSRDTPCGDCGRIHEERITHMRLTFDAEDWIILASQTTFHELAVPTNRLSTSITRSCHSSYAVVDCEPERLVFDNIEDQIDTSEGSQPAWEEILITDELTVEGDTDNCTTSMFSLTYDSLFPSLQVDAEHHEPPSHG